MPEAWDAPRGSVRTGRPVAIPATPGGASGKETVADHLPFPAVRNSGDFLLENLGGVAATDQDGQEFANRTMPEVPAFDEIHHETAPRIFALPVFELFEER